ncbi:2-amino-4-hydroxy-6-hydroxymethyldihydropteridine diphosphokinase [Pedobacter insulae]|uniref:2-amino-4-hydroxy-6-hydroxymethyldihydropteridine pyrophosphokinase n=1 Tax=Pedobacter insulae TaxID=414048 RepID=A0A1I3A9H9_9SPHI|nr:2-amino-4-hydroxy-6-hydroxymethyldihydropteridine diphosphokinase [Pedobacter insulae]SFH46688.1 2-amino-4-hydroxy-6-hydroxymethyldihydropteridinediphosphokinase [Pedobacter insulae]
MLSDKNTVHLLLGSNLGNRQKIIDEALTLLGQRVGEIQLTSSIYETAAWGKVDQPSFLNVAVAIQTELTPLQLLEAVLKIEVELGRVRHEKWGARMIDIDIILYGDEVVNLRHTLQIPHPEMHNRRFVLLPMMEIAPDRVHPVLQQNISELLANLTDDLSVLKR